MISHYDTILYTIILELYFLCNFIYLDVVVLFRRDKMRSSVGKRPGDNRHVRPPGNGADERERKRARTPGGLVDRQTDGHTMGGGSRPVFFLTECPRSQRARPHLERPHLLLINHFDRMTAATANGCRAPADRQRRYLLSVRSSFLAGSGTP